MTGRHLVVVDVETNGLNPQLHEAVEVAWWNLTNNESGVFVPKHNVSKVLAAADIKALQVNRYVDRIAGRPQDGSQNEQFRLWNQLDDATLMGSNPTFDAAMLSKLFATGEDSTDVDVTPWHHRLWDLSAYAAGVLGLDELPGLAKVCELLDVPVPDHSAMVDVRSTGLCFQALFARAGVAS